MITLSITPNMDRTKIVWTKSSLNRKCCRIAGRLKFFSNLKNMSEALKINIFFFSKKYLPLKNPLYYGNITSLLESLTWRWWIGSERTRRWQKCRQQILLGTLLGRSSQSTTQYWFGFQWQIESTSLVWLKEGNWFLTTTINDSSLLRFLLIATFWNPFYYEAMKAWSYLLELFQVGSLVINPIPKLEMKMMLNS